MEAVETAYKGYSAAKMSGKKFAAMMSSKINQPSFQQIPKKVPEVNFAITGTIMSLVDGFDKMAKAFENLTASVGYLHGAVDGMAMSLSVQDLMTVQKNTQIHSSLKMSSKLLATQAQIKELQLIAQSLKEKSIPILEQGVIATAQEAEALKAKKSAELDGWPFKPEYGASPHENIFKSMSLSKLFAQELKKPLTGKASMTLADVAKQMKMDQLASMKGAEVLVTGGPGEKPVKYKVTGLNVSANAIDLETSGLDPYHGMSKKAMKKIFKPEKIPPPVGLGHVPKGGGKAPKNGDPTKRWDHLPVREQIQNSLIL